MCIVSVPDGQGPGSCCAGRAWLRGHRPVGRGSPLWGWGSHFSPPGCGPRRGVPRRSDERGRRAGACLPNLVSATTRAATSCPGPVATLQREVPSQTEGVCLSSTLSPFRTTEVWRASPRATLTASAGPGGPCRGLEAAGVVGSCPGHRHSQQRPAGSLERSRRPPVLTLLPPSSPSTGP